MDERIQTRQRFAGLMGVASSADCVGGRSYNGKRPARAPSVDGEPTHDHARGQLTTISRRVIRGCLPTERFEDFH